MYRHVINEALMAISGSPDQAKWWKSATPQQQQQYLRKHRSKKHQNAQRRVRPVSKLIQPKAKVEKRAHITSAEAGQKFAKLSKEMWNLCTQMNWGDPFTYGRHREIDMAISLGHSIGEGWKGGADGYDENNKPVEYKATITKKINGSYNGISVQMVANKAGKADIPASIAKQKAYIHNKKIGPYAHHYIARYEGPKIAEAYMVPGPVVERILWPKIQKQLENILRNPGKLRSDPRIGVSLTNSEILEHGTQLKFNPKKNIFENEKS
jgi:hypothetical protein